MDDGSEMMPMGKALWILAESHTRDDDLAGFVVVAGGHADLGGTSRSDYIEAWRSVRFNIGKPVEPG